MGIAEKRIGRDVAIDACMVGAVPTVVSVGIGPDVVIANDRDSGSLIKVVNADTIRAITDNIVYYDGHSCEFVAYAASVNTRIVENSVVLNHRTGPPE